MKQRVHLLHGMSKRPEYKHWVQMKQRCLNKNGKRYCDYGGRGIIVAPEWINDFPAFLAHVGPRPSAAHWLDRINNSRGYVPGNVRWAIRVEQMRNTRRSRLVTINGKTQCISAWCEELGLKQDTVWGRIKKGWPEEAALLTPVAKQKDYSQQRDDALRLRAEGKTLTEVANEVGVAFQTVSDWWRQSGGAEFPNVGRRNALRNSKGRFQ